MNKAIVVILLAATLVPLFPVGLDDKRVSFVGWLWRHTTFGPDFTNVPEEDYLRAFEDYYGSSL